MRNRKRKIISLDKKSIRAFEGLSLRWLFVDPDSRGKSCGEHLLSAAFRIAEERGLDEIRVHFPDVYGFRSFCRNDRSFFLGHGFRETEDGRIVSTLEDYHKATEYSEPADFDEEELLEQLLAMGGEEEENDTDIFSSIVHKPWSIRSVGLSEFSKMTSVLNIVKAGLAGMNSLKSGTIGELSFSKFREGIELCEKNQHAGYLESLFDTPVGYFDMDVSSYTMADDQVSGMCLVHYNKMENSLSVELIFTTDTDNLKGFAELNRIFLLSANKKYDPDTKLILPYDEKLHKPLIKKIFGE